jgi:diguanylate cyclase (GGDEF)-like protein
MNGYSGLGSIYAHLGAIRKAFRIAANPAAVLAIAAMLLCGVLVERQGRESARQQQRADVLNQLSAVRSNLEGRMLANVQVVRGLVATIATEPDLAQERFEAIARYLLDGVSNELRNVAAAPGMVIKMISPMKGNERAIGLDYRKQPLQSAAAMRAVAERRLVFAGPIDLRQGGQGFVGRYPVFTRSAEGERLWGLVAAVVDVDRLYKATGLLDPKLGIEVAISGRDGLPGNLEPFFGRQSTIDRDPVVSDVTLPSGGWKLYAIPKGGWTTADATLVKTRAGMLGAGAVLLFLLWWADRYDRERQAHSRDLGVMSKRLELALDVSEMGVWEQSIASGEMVWDARVCAIYGCATAPRFDEWIAMVHQDDRERVQADFELRPDHVGSYASDYRIVRADGAIRYLRSKATVVETNGEQHFVGTDLDVTADVEIHREADRARHLAEIRNVQLEEANARIEYNALHDALTGLPNRRYLDQVLRIEAGDKIALLHLDLDRFKQINDTLGHSAGDAMLKYVADILKKTARTSDFVARIGGDEFVIVCRGLEQDALADLSRRIVESIGQPVPYNDSLCRFGVSIGIAINVPGIESGPQLLVNADMALYRAKLGGRGRFEFFDSALQLETLRSKVLADDILRGLDRDEFTAHYQPQFNAKTLEVVGAEALVRWNHPMRGTLAPASFLKVAEEINVVGRLDRIILQKAVADQAALRSVGIEIGRVSVNVSLRRLDDPKLLKHVRELAIQPGMVSFELVESIFLDETDAQQVSNIEQIKAAGIDIEIDDFGTGHASIVSLVKVKPRRFKIDRQLISPVVQSDAARDLVRSMVQIGRSLGIEVVAEGVETQDHVRVLRDLGCDILQGYALGRPMPLRDLMKALRPEAKRLRG